PCVARAAPNGIAEALPEPPTGWQQEPDTRRWLARGWIAHKRCSTTGGATTYPLRQCIGAIFGTNYARIGRSRPAAVSSPAEAGYARTLALAGRCWTDRCGPFRLLCTRLSIA